jgi:hypothetical protein
MDLNMWRITKCKVVREHGGIMFAGPCKGRALHILKSQLCKSSKERVGMTDTCTRRSGPTAVATCTARSKRCRAELASSNFWLQSFSVRYSAKPPRPSRPLSNENSNSFSMCGRYCSKLPSSTSVCPHHHVISRQPANL